MVQEQDALSEYSSSEGVTTRIYNGLLALEEGVAIDEDYLGYQSIISFSRVRNEMFPNVFVSAPEQLVTRRLKEILNESSPVWADSSDEITCFVCSRSKPRENVYSVPCIKFTNKPDVHLVKDMDKNYMCTDCTYQAQNVIHNHIDESEYKEKFLATQI